MKLKNIDGKINGCDLKIQDNIKKIQALTEALEAKLLEEVREQELERFKRELLVFNPSSIFADPVKGEVLSAVVMIRLPTLIVLDKNQNRSSTESD